MSLLDLIFPPFCAGCGKLGTYFCKNCYERVDFFTLPIRLHLEPCYLDQLIAAARYEPPLTNLVKMMKYQSVKDIGKICGRLLYYSTDFPTADVIISVPLHYRRRWDRGFNQAEVIARELSQIARVPYFNLLNRKRHVRYQAEIANNTLRINNVKDIFHYAPSQQFIHTQIPINRPLTALLIDDVATTGSTLNECAKVLKQHGFSRVYGLTIAHGQ